MELSCRQLLDHAYAMIVEPLTDPEQREAYDSWLWSDPAIQAEIDAVLGR